ncbi:MAG: multidrug efflux RND transporter permease subunit [Usitatibacter sp.]
MKHRNFFVERPIFSGVIAILITLAGLAASQVLGVSQYPEIAPPTVTITANYPGASAETLARTVAAPIEEQLSGIENLIYFNSSSASNGTLTITCTFDVGTNVDLATINVSNRVKIAEPRLPDDVRRTGVLVQKRSTDILMVVGIRSTDPRYDTLYLSNYTTLNVLDSLKRVPGVADAFIFGARDYSMRVWLKPDVMARLGVTTSDIANALRAQNAQFAAGKIGQEPTPEDQAFTYTVTTRGRLVEPEEFGNIVLRASGPGGALRLKDVARIELGALGYDAFTRVDGKPTIGVPVFLQSGANALAVNAAVRVKMDELAKTFPEGVEYIVSFDTTRVVQASIREVVHTLIEAAILVILVVFVFLQSWRATLIPMIAVPVSLIGAFAGLYLFGFTINTMTLFAIVLATGIVVDDAIVVLENVERLMAEKGMSPYEASVESMREVTGAIIAIELVLCSVFIPVAFLGGIAGRLYQQFAVTVVTAVLLSGLTALTLTPALCALLLKRQHSENKLFRPFNRGFAWVSAKYNNTVGRVLHHRIASLGVFAALVIAVVLGFRVIPSSFVPIEDQGFLYGSIILPDGATLTRTGKVAAEVQKLLAEHPAVERVFTVTGFDLIGGGNKTNAGTLFITLKPWQDRDITAGELAKYVGQKAGSIRDGIAIAFNPPPIRGLGQAGGLEFYLENRADGDPKRLGREMNAFADALRKRPELTGINALFRPTVPQVSIDVDNEKALSLGVPINEVFEALASTMGALYVNDFNKFGRTYRVQVQAESAYRATLEGLGNVYVRSATTQEMIPLKALVKARNIVGADQVDRFNGFVAAKMLGSGVAGVSSGQSIAIVEEEAAKLPQGFQIEWAGQAFQEKRTGNQSVIAFSLALVLVFLILAANYERWALPVAVLLSVPFAVLGALAFVLVRGLTNDIYFQIGLVTLIGLAAKNAILIVEFANQEMIDNGLSPIDAAVKAARMRFRPIVMTSLAFCLGVTPLVVATGAGAAARQSMGTGVLGGMLVATFVATLFIPLFFVLLAGKLKPKTQHEPLPEAVEGTGEHA